MLQSPSGIDFTPYDKKDTDKLMIVANRISAYYISKKILTVCVLD